jgi:hypothetical protein
MDPYNTPNFEFSRSFWNGLNAKFWISTINLLQWFDVFYPQKDTIH